MASNRFKIKQEWQEGGYRVVIDEHLDENSSNPVANWVLKEAIAQGGGGGGTWGTITGTITDQTDLIQYINAHGAGTWGAITGTLTDQTDLVQYITNALTNYYTKSQVYTKGEVDALIPTVSDKTLTIQKNGSDVGTFTANSAQDRTINITVPTTAADVSALPDSTKYGASIIVSLDSSTYVLTTTLKDQDGNTLGTAQTVDLPIESVVVSGSYDSATKEVVLVLENGSEIRFSVADLVSGLQPEITSSNKLSADLVDDTSTTHKFTTASDISKLAGIEANANNYILPAATTSTLGGVKVGEHLEIDANGVLETDVNVALYDEPDTPQPIPPVTTDRIVQMKDKNGNKCFPIAANPGAPKASDIQLGLMRTGTNLEADADGVVRVNGSDSFTTSDKEVYSASKMNADHRFSYNLKADQNIDTNVPGNVDLNTTQYLKVGTYYCSSSATGQTITNNPANGAFTMRVYNPIAGDYDDESTNSWCYRVRELKDLSGNEWRQSVYANGTAGVFSYYAWQKVVRQNDLLNMVYPVGSIYMSVNNVSPQTFLGGTWQAFGAGRTLVGVDTSQTEFDTVQNRWRENAYVDYR